MFSRLPVRFFLTGRYRPRGWLVFALFEHKSGAGTTNESSRRGKGGSGPAGLCTGVLGAAEPADGAGAPGHSRHPPGRVSRTPERL